MQKWYILALTFKRSFSVFDESSPQVPGDQSTQILGSFSPSLVFSISRTRAERGKGESERLNEEDLVFWRRQYLWSPRTLFPHEGKWSFDHQQKKYIYYKEEKRCRDSGERKTETGWNGWGWGWGAKTDDQTLTAWSQTPPSHRSQSQSRVVETSLHSGAGGATGRAWVSYFRRWGF